MKEQIFPENEKRDNREAKNFTTGPKFEILATLVNLIKDFSNSKHVGLTGAIICFDDVSLGVNHDIVQIFDTHNFSYSLFLSY